jgi:hypothetical protein
MRAMKIAIPATILLGGLLACTSSMFGTAEYAKKEKKFCTVCRAKVAKPRWSRNKYHRHLLQRQRSLAGEVYGPKEVGNEPYCGALIFGFRTGPQLVASWPDVGKRCPVTLNPKIVGPLTVSACRPGVFEEWGVDVRSQ